MRKSCGGVEVKALMDTHRKGLAQVILVNPLSNLVSVPGQ